MKKRLHYFRSYSVKLYTLLSCLLLALTFLFLSRSTTTTTTKTRQKKKLVIAYESIPHNVEGAERYLSTIIRTFADVKFDLAVTFIARSSSGKCGASASDMTSLIGGGGGGGVVHVIEEATPDSDVFAHLMTLPNTVLLLPLSFFESCGGSGVNSSSEDYSLSLRSMQKAAKCNTIGSMYASPLCATQVCIFSFDAQADRARGLSLYEPHVEQALRYQKDMMSYNERENNLYNRGDVLVMLTKEDLSTTTTTRQKRAVLYFRDDLPSHLLLTKSDSSTPEQRALSATFILPKWKQRDGFVFVGSGNSGTNQVALWLFLKTVWPRVHAALPNTFLHIVGPKPSTLCKHYEIWCSWTEDLLEESIQNVVIEGLIDDLDTFLSQRRIGIAPMITGTGINTKTGLFLARGLPVVGTTKAARGYELNSGGGYGAGLLVIKSENENSFGGDYASTLIRLYRNEFEWKIASEAALLLSIKLDEERKEALDVHALIRMLF
jgi:hypothetical protein